MASESHLLVHMEGDHTRLSGTLCKASMRDLSHPDSCWPAGKDYTEVIGTTSDASAVHFRFETNPNTTDDRPLPDDRVYPFYGMHLKVCGRVVRDARARDTRIYDWAATCMRSGGGGGGGTCAATTQCHREGVLEWQIAGGDSHRGLSRLGFGSPSWWNQSWFYNPF